MSHCLCYLFFRVLRFFLICFFLFLSMPMSFRWRLSFFVPISIRFSSSWGQGYNTFFSLYLAYSATSSEMKKTIFYKIVPNNFLHPQFINACCKLVFVPSMHNMVDFEKFSIIEIEINWIENFRTEIKIGFYRISFSGFCFWFQYNFENIKILQFDIFRYKIQLVLFR